VARRLHDRSLKRVWDAPVAPWERLAKDERGEQIRGGDREEHAQRCPDWAPDCPDRRSWQVRRALGFWERNLSELELRIALGGNDDGVCQVVVDEQEHEVYVRVLVHCENDSPRRSRDHDYLDCPVRVWLERPLGKRAVIDVDSDEELHLFTPAYLNNVPQADHGYRPVNRRSPRAH
jgi:hypothetical protein